MLEGICFLVCVSCNSFELEVTAVGIGDTYMYALTHDDVKDVLQPQLYVPREAIVSEIPESGLLNLDSSFGIEYIRVDWFSNKSTILSNLKDSSIKKLIAREFNLPQHLVLENWVKCLVNLRNCIAHHARVWNRNFPAIPQFNISLRGKWVSNFNVNHVKLYPQLCLIEYFIQNIQVECRFKEKLIELLDKNPTIDINAMGFPKNWKDEALWLY